LGWLVGSAVLLDGDDPLQLHADFEKPLSGLVLGVMEFPLHPAADKRGGATSGLAPADADFSLGELVSPHGAEGGLWIAFGSHSFVLVVWVSPSRHLETNTLSFRTHRKSVLFYIFFLTH
jgi:hypothetical protein